MTLYLFTWRSSIDFNPVQFSAVASTKEAARQIILDRLEAYRQKSLHPETVLKNTLSLEGHYVPPAWNVLTSFRVEDDLEQDKQDFATLLSTQEPTIHPITEGLVIFSSCLDG